ncbi:type VI secretion system-associated FHA domain protein TagH [Roseibium sp. RKSG952]|uniref:type VI secretion system-associated FHA domain protein TagH n=1 Tax=Roseibium sp. RKSG952 TaxID=2529384 RepID=UPI0012BCB3D7|nr:type VI secretion system-associated FHA domain protein TagH [Roseibium sp. RKSG952]MTH98018.1 type VI secretion system-associated FHA domain protein TagH [Roseibium sp. RKSG952]
MRLVLHLLSSGSLPGGLSCIQMQDGALTIGRGEENDLSLPDPDRVLSKRHCAVEERNGDYVLIDVSTNGTFLNYGLERIGEFPAPLNDGDVILVGAYELKVEISAGQSQQVSFDPLPPAQNSLLLPEPEAAAGPPADFGDPLDGSNEPWDPFLDDPLAPAVPSSDRAIRHDPDFLDDPLDVPEAPSDPFLTGGPFADGPFDVPGPRSVADHNPAVQDHFKTPSVRRPLIPDDWDDLVPDARPVIERAPEPAPALRPTPAPAAPPEPHRGDLREAPHSSAIASEPFAGQQGTKGNDAALAFLAAAGAAHLTIPPEELEETMARLGRVFAALISGMREILLARASIKSEMRMTSTMISSDGNNPLKFSVSPQHAVEAMIRPSVAGYLPAESAAEEALRDIRAHEIAMMSGMEAALKDLLHRLSPDQLSGRIANGPVLGSFLGGKKAKYWEAYEQMFSQIARETEDNFQSTFGREFARAYQDQIQKL